MTIVGTDDVFYAAVETTFDTHQAFTGAQALYLESLDIEPDVPFIKSKEKNGSASLFAEYADISGGKFKATFLLRANAAGTAPPHDALYRAAFGAAPSFPGGNTSLYNLAAAGPISLQLARRSGAQFYEVINGCVVTDIELDYSTGAARVNVSGEFASYGCVVGTPVTTATVTSGATSFTLAATSQNKIRRNARIQIGTDNNTSAGYAVTDVSAAGVVTFSPALGTTQSGATNITSFAPTPTFAGTLIGGVDGLLTIDSTTTDFQTAKLSMKTGNHLLKKEASRTRPGRASRGERDITVEILAYADESLQQSLAINLGGSAPTPVLRNIVLRAGSNTAAQRAQFEMGAVRMALAPVKVPEAEEATVAMMGTPRRVSVAEDELALRFN